MISVENIRVRYGALTAVDGVSLAFEAGGAYGLVGESGCGKSTLLAVMAGLEKGYEGTVTVAGRDIRALARRARARLVQMVFQDPAGALHPRQTIATALADPLRVHGIGDRHRKVTAALEAVGLDPVLRHRFPHQVSGGQRQRVAIARALMLEPPVLLLDEPTSALDVESQNEILALLARLHRERSMTLVLVSHDLAVVGALCDTIAIMRAGRLVETIARTALAAPAGCAAYTRELIDLARLGN